MQACKTNRSKGFLQVARRAGERDVRFRYARSHAADLVAQLLDAAPALGGSQHHGHGAGVRAFAHAQRLADGLPLRQRLLVGQLVRLGQRNGERQSRFLQERHHVAVERAGVVPYVDQRHHQRKVAVDQAGPALFLGLGDLRETVPRQVDQVRVVHFVEVDGRRLPRLRGHLGQPLAEHQLVQQRRLAYVRAACERHLGALAFGQLRRRAVRRQVFCKIEVHATDYNVAHTTGTGAIGKRAR